VADNVFTFISSEFERRLIITSLYLLFETLTKHCNDVDLFH